MKGYAENRWPDRHFFIRDADARVTGEKRAIFQRGRRIPEDADLSMEVGHAALTHRHDDKIVISGVIVSQPQPTAPARIIGDAIGVRLALSP
jgi:hypothetical protein